MSLKQYALLIPERIRRERILINPDVILTASPVIDNFNMKLLAEIWYQFIEPNKEKTYCPICLKNILENFRQIRPFLVELEEEAIKLDAL